MKTEEKAPPPPAGPRVRIAVLGKVNVGKSALTVRFLTRRFIGEYRSNTAKNPLPEEFLSVRTHILGSANPRAGRSTQHTGRRTASTSGHWALRVTSMGLLTKTTSGDDDFFKNASYFKECSKQYKLKGKNVKCSNAPR
ncbi:Ras-like protein family member 11B [Gryllus bimaculatus]|nr:Ras-like protein family member 11B [Gryllus bimaculatus]